MIIANGPSLISIRNSNKEIDVSVYNEEEEIWLTENISISEEIEQFLGFLKEDFPPLLIFTKKKSEKNNQKQKPIYLDIDVLSTLSSNQIELLKEEQDKQTNFFVVSLKQIKNNNSNNFQFEQITKKFNKIPKIYSLIANKINIIDIPKKQQIITTKFNQIVCFEEKKFKWCKKFESQIKKIEISDSCFAVINTVTNCVVLNLNSSDPQKVLFEFKNIYDFFIGDYSQIGFQQILLFKKEFNEKKKNNSSKNIKTNSKNDKNNNNKFNEENFNFSSFFFCDFNEHYERSPPNLLTKSENTTSSNNLGTVVDGLQRRLEVGLQQLSKHKENVIFFKIFFLLFFLFFFQFI